MAISNTLIHWWPLVIAVIVGLPVLLKIALRSKTFACAFDRGG